MTAAAAVVADRDLLREAFEAGALIMGPTFDAWYAERFPPPLPDEPPEGAAIRGRGANVWMRDDTLAVAQRWWLTGAGQPFTWAEAYARSADPNRPLVELPDPHSVVAMQDLAGVVRRPPGTCAAIVRGLAERGAVT